MSLIKLITFERKHYLYHFAYSKQVNISNCFIAYKIINIIIDIVESGFINFDGYI